MKNNIVWGVYLIAKNKKKNFKIPQMYRKYDTHCAAFFSSEKKAKSFLKTNAYCLQDYLYTYAVIGKVFLNVSSLQQEMAGYDSKDKFYDAGLFYKFKQVHYESGATDTVVVKLKKSPNKKKLMPNYWIR